MINKIPRMQGKYNYLRAKKDRRYESNYVHVDSNLECGIVCDHNILSIIQRQLRSPNVEEFIVHYEIIAFAN